MNDKTKPDYIKILFIGFPLFFMLWFLVGIAVALFSRDPDVKLYGSFLGAVILMAVYLYVSIKFPSKFDVGVKNDADMFKFIAERHDNDLLKKFNSSSKGTKRAAYLLLSFFIFMSLLIIAINIAYNLGYW